MKPLAAALGFLSVFPLPACWQEQAALARSLPYFPVVGLVFGVAAAALAGGLAVLLPPAPAGALLVIALALLSGGLHVDGLADTADGFFSSRPKERILEIMRDSRTGPMGAAAVACVLLLKCAAVASMPPHWFVRAAFLMPLAGRCSIVLVMTWLTYARPGGGLATVFGSARSWHALWAAALLGGSGWFVAGWRGLAATALVIIATAMLSRWSWRKIGGYTGDTLGATCEIVEAVPSLVFASQLWPGGAR
jgi:adenosylcobinamide-GDP ribazoletransferase